MFREEDLSLSNLGLLKELLLKPVNKRISELLEETNPPLVPPFLGNFGHNSPTWT